jgi:hypothetical protein
VYHCEPDEQRATAPDRLVSVEITIKPNGDFASVLYRAANGAAYSRGQQYEATSGQDGAEHYWTGTLRTNRNIAIVGAFRRVDGRLVYYETIHDKLQADKIVAHVTSICGCGHPTIAESAPPQTLTAPSPPVSFPDREFKAFLDCVDAAAVALASRASKPKRSSMRRSANAHTNASPSRKRWSVRAPRGPSRQLMVWRRRCGPIYSRSCLTPALRLPSRPDRRRASRLRGNRSDQTKRAAGCLSPMPRRSGAR